MENPTEGKAATARFDKVLTDYLTWKASSEVQYADRITAMQSRMEEVGEYHFHDYLAEAMDDFMNRMTSLCIPEYGPAWINGYHRVSEWVNANAVRNGRDRLLAICSGGGIARVEAIISSLAAEATPAAPPFSPKP